MKVYPEFSLFFTCWGVKVSLQPQHSQTVGIVLSIQPINTTTSQGNYSETHVLSYRNFQDYLKSQWRWDVRQRVC